MSYESPIKVVQNELNTQFDNEVYKVVQQYGVSVSKEELIKALRYDRNQYDIGFADGKREAMREIVGESIKAVYKYSTSGSGLHIVLDDMNTERHFIEWCIEKSIPQIEDEAERRTCAMCANLLLKVSKAERDRIIQSVV